MEKKLAETLKTMKYRNVNDWKIIDILLLPLEVSLVCII